MQRSTSTIQPCPKIHHDQVSCFSHILAGKVHCKDQLFLLWIYFGATSLFKTYMGLRLCKQWKLFYHTLKLFSQGVLVFLAAKSGFIKDAEKAAYLQNFVLCVEMLIAAVGHQYSFSYKDYAGSNARPFGGFRGSLLHALKFSDFYHDTVHQVYKICEPHSVLLMPLLT